MYSRNENGKKISVDLAEFLNRLFINGHLAEKSIFVISAVLFGFTFGFFMGRYTLTKQITAAGLRPPSVAKRSVNESRMPASSPVSPGHTAVVNAPEPEVAITQKPQDMFYYTIRVASSKLEKEIQKTIPKYEKICDHVETEYSNDLRRFLLYCGKFSDLEAAEGLFAKLKTKGKMIIRKPASL